MLPAPSPAASEVLVISTEETARPQTAHKGRHSFELCGMLVETSSPNGTDLSHHNSALALMMEPPYLEVYNIIEDLGSVLGIEPEAESNAHMRNWIEEVTLPVLTELPLISSEEEELQIIFDLGGLWTFFFSATMMAPVYN